MKEGNKTNGKCNGGWNLQIRDMYSMFITVLLQDLVNRIRIPMMHCAPKSHTVCRSVDTSQAVEFLCLDILLQQKCLYLVSNGFSGFFSVKM